MAVAATAIALYAWGEHATDVAATPIGAPSAPAFVNVGQPFSVSASHTGGAAATLTATETNVAGSFGSCSDSTGGIGSISNSTGIDTCTVTSLATVTTTVSASYTCFAPGTVLFTLTHGGVTSAAVAVSCGGAQQPFPSICNPALGIYDPCLQQGMYPGAPGYPVTQPVYPQPIYPTPVPAAVAAAPTAVPQQIPVTIAPQVVQPVIIPPSTGDAGLLPLP